MHLFLLLVLIQCHSFLVTLQRLEGPRVSSPQRWVQFQADTDSDNRRRAEKAEARANVLEHQVENMRFKEANVSEQLVNVQLMMEDVGKRNQELAMEKGGHKGVLMQAPGGRPDSASSVRWQKGVGGVSSERFERAVNGESTTSEFAQGIRKGRQQPDPQGGYY